MKTVKRITSLLIAAMFCASLLSGCSADGTAEFLPFQAVESDSIEIKAENAATGLEMPPAVTALNADKTEVSLVTGNKAELSVQIEPEDAWNKEIRFSSGDETIATVDENGSISAVSPGKCTVTVSSVEMPDVFEEISVTVKAPVVKAPPKNNDTDATSTNTNTAQPTEITYIDGILIVNKTYALPADYNPGVDSEAYAALQQMFADAAAEGINLWIASGFRSYSRQNSIYNNYVAQDGKAAADRYSARPGYSEHQTGLAFDLNYLTQAFGQSPEGLWLAENCHKYGFIIRYPEGKENITGYMYEPWHVRYLGVDVATAVYESGLTLEEYLGITSVYAEN